MHAYESIEDGEYTEPNRLTDALIDALEDLIVRPFLYKICTAE